MRKKKSMYTVRNRKHNKHPQVIVGADKTSFESMSLTHKQSEKRHSNIPLPHNPKQDDTQPAYLRKQVVRDFKFNFSKAFRNYSLSNEDIDTIIQFLEKKKRK